MKHSAYSIAPVLLCVSCASAPRAEEAAVETAPSVVQSLTFGDGATATSVLLPIRLPSPDGSSSAAEQQDPANVLLVKMDQAAFNGVPSVWKQCGVAVPKVDDHGKEIAPLIAAAAAWAVEKVVGLVVDEASSKLQKEVDAYTVTTTFKSQPFDFYAGLTKGMRLPRYSKYNATSCFRAVRLGPKNPANPKSDLTVIMDFVGAVEYNALAPQLVTVRPVRIYFQRLVSKNDDKRVAISINLDISVTALEQTKSTLTKSAISAPLVAEIIDTSKILPDTPYYKVYAESDPKYEVVAIPPWDYNANLLAIQRNSSSATLRETEVSDVPWLLKTVSSLLSKNKDDASKELTTLATKKLGLSTSSGSSAASGSSK